MENVLMIVLSFWFVLGFEPLILRLCHSQIALVDVGERSASGMHSEGERGREFESEK
jgi:hypothetical protein